MGYFCGMESLFSCAWLPFKIGRSHKTKDEEEPPCIAISGPFHFQHDMHITEDDVDAAYAAVGGNMINMEDLMQYRAQVQAPEGDGVEEDANLSESDYGDF